MNKELIIAKIRRWQAELNEMIVTLQQEGKCGPILNILKKRENDMRSLIDAISDTSFISPGDVGFEPKPVLNEIEEKVKKVKAGVRKIRKLTKEETKIISELEKT